MSMVYILLLASALSFSAECVEYKDSPMLVVKAEKNHYIRFLKGEDKLCEKLASDFVNRKVKRVCGCSHIDYKYEEDTVRLRCAEPVSGKMYSRTTATYYYYPDMVPACIKMRDHLMYKAK